MAKVQAPILSMGAQGQIGNSMVFAAWKGVNYARRYVTPSNPRTMAQRATRTVFAALGEQYKRLGPLSRAPWESAVQRRALTARNAVVSNNLPLLRNATDMAAWIASPGSNGGLPLTSFSATSGAASGEIDVNYETSKAPAGWTLNDIVFQALHDHDPTVEPTVFTVEQQAMNPTPASTGTDTISGLVTGDSYVISAWPKWSKPDGQIAYGPAMSAGLVSAN